MQNLSDTERGFLLNRVTVLFSLLFCAFSPFCHNKGLFGAVPQNNHLWLLKDAFKEFFLIERTFINQYESKGL